MKHKGNAAVAFPKILRFNNLYKGQFLLKVPRRIIARFEKIGHFGIRGRARIWAESRKPKRSDVAEDLDTAAVEHSMHNIVSCGSACAMSWCVL